MDDSTGLLPGTLDLLILKAVSLGKLHGYGVLLRIQQITGGALQIQQGALYPALPPRAPGADRQRVGHVGQQPSREVLQPHAQRTRTARQRSGELEPHRGRHRHGVADDGEGDLNVGPWGGRARALARAVAIETDSTPTCRRRCASTSSRKRTASRRSMGSIRKKRAARPSSDSAGSRNTRKKGARRAGSIGSMVFRWTRASASACCVKHRWLTLVGGVAMTVAIAIGATAFEVINDLLDPALPFPQGDRVVAVKYVAAKTGGADDHVLHAFSAWRDRLTTLEQVGAFRTAQHNFVAPNAPPEPIKVAEITASAFDVAQTPPLLGRYLLRSDEQAAAAPVVVIGHDAWRLRFNADPHIVGRTIQLGGTLHTVVGVMPDGFAFPVRPSVLDSASAGPLEVPPVGRSGARCVCAPEARRHQRHRQKRSSRPPDARSPTRIRTVATACGRSCCRSRASISSSADPSIVWLLRAAQLLRRRAGVRRRHQSRDPALRADGHPSRRDRGADRAWREPRAHPVAAVHRSADADRARRRRRAGLRRRRAATDRVDGACQWRLPVLDPLRAVAGERALRPRARRRRRRDHGRASWPEGDGQAAVCESAGAEWTDGDAPRLPVDDADRRASRCRRRDPAGSRVHLVARRGNGTQGAGDSRRSLRRREHEPERRGDRARSRAGAAAAARADGEAARGAGRHCRDVLVGRSRGLDRIAGSSFKTRRGDATAARRRWPRSTSMSHCSRLYGARMLAGRDFDARDTGSSTAVIVNRTFATEVLGGPAHAALGTRFRYTTRTDWFEIVGVVDDFPGFPRGPGSEAEPTMYRPAAPGDVPSGCRVAAFRRSDSRGDLGAPASDWRTDRSGAAVAARGSAVGLLRRAPLRLADDRVGGGHHHDQRPAALGGRHARADVVHDRAADTRNRHPFGARRAATPVADRRLRTRDAAARRSAWLVGSLISVAAFRRRGSGWGRARRCC